MKSKIISVLFIFCLSIPCYAHSGRLDGSGGHRVNKEYVYEGRYIEIKDKQMEYKVGKIIFEKGDYHYHVKPSANGFKNGIYIPVQDVNKTITSNIYHSEENRVASKKSDKYHLPSCPYIRHIKEENIVIFEDPEDAVSNGYKPCKRCKSEAIQ